MIPNYRYTTVEKHDGWHYFIWRGKKLLSKSLPYASYYDAYADAIYRVNELNTPRNVLLRKLLETGSN